ncbi:MAG: hypothetical protein S4CHLAM2_05540 [Chlamydiales bacterium]|nr:hypothetical protein [Chlamydiales bacterium]
MPSFLGAQENLLVSTKDETAFSSTERSGNCAHGEQTLFGHFLRFFPIQLFATSKIFSWLQNFGPLIPPC